MQVFDSLQAYQQQCSHCVATIGKYDGMHVGHQQILRTLMQESARLGLPAVVILSEPHPEEYFAGDKAPPRLQQLDEKVDYLAEFGLDAVFCLQFNEALRLMSAEDFITDILVRGLGVKSLVVGSDFAFGRDRQGNLDLLRAKGGEQDFTVHEVPAELVHGERVSSTLVREYLAAGDCESVQRLLGRPYSITGRIRAGRQLGRELGFPTANIIPGRPNLAVSGVYAVTASIGDNPSGSLPAVANVGHRPTVSTGQQTQLEVHILDFEGDLYDRAMTVHFLHRIRDEQKFEDVSALQAQIQRDIDTARTFFSREHGQQAS